MIDTVNQFIAAVGRFIDGHPGLILAATIVSAALLLASLVLMPAVIVNLPEDHFIRKKAKAPARLPVLRALLAVARNALGIVLLPLGVLLLLVPGPGWLTILAGIALLNFPFKHALEAKVLSLRVVRNAVDALRAKYGKKPFLFPKTATEAQRTQRGKKGEKRKPGISQRSFQRAKK